MRFPDFFIVGAAKSGTTSLWKYLGRHERIFMTKEIAAKELGFFCNDYGIKNVNQYLAHFSGATSTQLIGESCHAYLSSPESPELIWNSNPQAKIIIILRDPMERAYSLYNWMVQNGYEYLSFSSSLERERRVVKDKSLVQKPYFHSYWRNYLYIETGMYFDQVKRFYERFPPDRILTLIAEDFKMDPCGSTNKVLNFLELKGFEKNEFSFRPENESKRIHFRLLNFICFQLIRKTRKKNALGILIKSFCEFIIELNRRNEVPKRLNVNVRRQLLDIYRPDILKLEALIGRKLTSWLQG